VSRIRPPNKSQISNLGTPIGRWALVIVILLVGLFFRAQDLDRVPPGLDGDEMFNGWDALRVWKGNLAVYFPANYGREPVLIYLIALTIRLLGTGPWTMRLASVVCGVLGLALTWSFARRLYSARAAALTVALMSVSLWSVFLNRIALRAGLQPTCQVVALYALWRALEGGDRAVRWAVVAGLFTGLTLYTYTAGRVFPLLLVLWLLVAWLLELVPGSVTDPAAGRSLLRGRGNGRRLALAGLIAGLVVLPLGLFALRYPETFNQRVSSLSFELSQLQAGNLEPLWRSVTATLGMFTQAGDWDWRYNPAGRPVFDWVTGAFFYLGLLVSLFRLRRPAHSLLLVWLPVLLVPSVLSIGTPSFLRTAGALTPIYLLPAIGADLVWEQMERHASRIAPYAARLVRWALPLATVAGLLLIAADTYGDYFIDWPRSPQVLHTYEADLAAAARYLDEQAPAGVPVWISSDYPGDLSRRLVDLQSHYAGPIRWFDGNRVTVWPSGSAGQDVLILFTKTSPPNPDALSALGDYLVYQEDDGAGQPHLWIYRIPGERLSGVPWRPGQTVGGRFAWNREILGYDAPAQVERGTSVPVIVYWRVPPGVEYDPDDLPFSFVCIQDRAAGRCLDDAPPHYNPYPVWDWTVGDVVAQRYWVPVPAYLLPQTSYFHVGLFTSAGDVSFADEESAGVPLLLGPVEVTGTATLDPLWGADTPTFGQELALVEYSVPTERSPGSTLRAKLLWQAKRAPSADYVLCLELRGRADGEVVAAIEELLGSDRHPTSRWVSGEPGYTFHRLRIPPDLGSGEFDVYLALLEAGGQRVVGTPILLGSLSVSGRPHNFELPAPEHPLSADFGSSIRLLGYDLKQVNPTGGGQIEVVLYWQALDTITNDYKVFVHLYHPVIEGGLPGQHDSPPGNGAFPTSSWLPGEVVADSHVVPIEPNADPGVSEIGVGFYLASTGERLPVLVDGQPQPNDVLILTEVEIE